MKLGDDVTQVYLPRPYEDEPLYGVAARHAARMGMEHHTNLSRALFGDARLVSVDLPTGLGTLAERAGFSLGLDALGIMSDLTLAPLHLGFATADHALACRTAMVSKSATHAANLFGVANSRVVRPARLRFCPACVAEQRAAFGECHWRRAHQIGGVSACAQHGCQLLDSTAPYRMGGDRRLFDAETTLPRDLGRSGRPATASAVIVARRCGDLLAGWRAGASPRPSHQWERSCAYRRRARDILLEFRDFFGPEELRAIGCDVDPDDPQEWPLCMLRRDGTRRHAVQHVLLDLFAENTDCVVPRSSGSPLTYPDPQPPCRDQDTLAAMRAWSNRGTGRPEAADTLEEVRSRRRVYDFLRVRAPGWLREQRAYNRKPMNQKRVDWDGRDAWWETLLREAADVVRNARPARRVTTSALVAAAGLPVGAASSLDRLPRCRATIATIGESVEDFECRKIDHVAAALEAEGRPVTPPEVRRLAGLTGPISDRARAALGLVHVQVRHCNDSVRLDSAATVAEAAQM